MDDLTMDDLTMDDLTMDDLTMDDLTMDDLSLRAICHHYARASSRAPSLHQARESR